MACTDEVSLLWFHNQSMYDNSAAPVRLVDQLLNEFND